MKNVVTPETARKLKEKGFPQPEPEFGQVWYDEYDQPVIMGECDSITGLVRGLNNGVLYGGKASELIDFAPTATDILRQLALAKPDSAFRNYLEFDALSNLYCATYEMEETCNENPAEAAALAWLEKYAK